MTELSEFELRLRCLEAAAKTPMVHNAGPAAGVIGVAQQWEEWVVNGTQPPAVPADAEPYWQDMAAPRPAARQKLGLPGK